MKKRLVAMLILALIATLALVVACAKVDEYCKITVSDGYGFVFNGASSVKKGTDYTFTVTAKEGYELTSVTAGDTRLKGDSGTYTVAGVTADTEIIVKTARKTFAVFFVGEGFETEGEVAVEYGGNYVFSLTVADGYKLTDGVPEVTANGTALTANVSGDKFEYVVENVTAELTVKMSGPEKLPGMLTIAKDTFDIELGKLTAEQQTAAYYLANVNGSWQGAECKVNVDLSDVDWSKNGTYTITYALDGHADYAKSAKVRLFANATLNNISVDLSDISTPVAELDGCQYVDRDIYAVGDEQVLLTARQFVAEQTTVGGSKVFRSHFSAEYLSGLSVGSYTYKVVNYSDCTIGNFTLTLTDNAEPAFTVNADDEYAYVVGDSFDFAKAVKNAHSAQNVVAKYFLTDPSGKTADCTDAYALPKTAGKYLWTIKYFRGETEVGNAREIGYLLIDNYGWSGVTVSASLDGNIVLSTVDNDPNQYTDKTAVLSNDYVAKHNTGNNNFAIVTFKVTEYTPSGKFDAGMWGLKGGSEYVGVGLSKVGATQNIMRVLGGSVDFIIRDFTGSIEILSVDFVNIPEGIGTKSTDAGYIDAEQNADGLVNNIEVRWLTAGENSQFHISAEYIDVLVQQGYTSFSATLDATQANIYVICKYEKDGKTTSVPKNYLNGQTLSVAFSNDSGTLTDVQMLIVNTHDSTQVRDFSGTLILSDIQYDKA